METSGRPRVPGRVRLTPRDLELLGFLANQRLALPDHVQSLLGLSAAGAQRRLRALRAGGFISARRIFHGAPAALQITRAGLRALGSDLPQPQLDLRCYQHDVDLAWVHLAARRGCFGPLRRIISEREMRSQDGRPGPAEHGVRLGGLGSHGRERLHYPDLMAVTAGGRRVAIELELSSKGRGRRERILAGYGADARVDAVLYLVGDERIARSIQASARRLGVASMVHVQRAVSWKQTRGVIAGRSADRIASQERSAASQSTVVSAPTGRCDRAEVAR